MIPPLAQPALRRGTGRIAMTDSDGRYYEVIASGMPAWREAKPPKSVRAIQMISTESYFLFLF